MISNKDEKHRPRGDVNDKFQIV